MDTSISRYVRADPRILYELAARVEDWPRILPHYRWVRVLDVSPDRRDGRAARRHRRPGLVRHPIALDGHPNPAARAACRVVRAHTWANSRHAGRLDLLTHSRRHRGRDSAHLRPPLACARPDRAPRGRRVLCQW